MRDDLPPARAPHWHRYRRFVVAMAALAVVTVAVALAALAAGGVVLRPAVVGAVAVGVGGMLLLAGVLMGLVFASAAGGHDDDTRDPTNAKGRPEGRPLRR